VSAIIAALSFGAAAFAKGALSEAGKDAYHALKNAVLQVASPGDVEKLEQNPGSEGRKEVLAEELDKSEKADDPDLAKLAEELLKALKDAGAVETAIGFSLEEVEAVNVHLKRISSSGTSVSIKKSKFIGDIEAEDLSAGVEPPGKPQRQ